MIKKNTKYWYVLYTKPRFEKKTHLQLSAKGIESFLPLQTVLRRWSDRKKKVEVPLFTSYVFIHAHEKERLLALQSIGVINCVGFKNRPAIIQDLEIENIKKLLNSGQLLEVIPLISVGSRVQIKKGPLSGMNGILTEIRGNNRFAVSFTEISKSISIEIPFQELEVIPDDKKNR
jgi:transcriptional antiterminator RfaH